MAFLGMALRIVSKLSGSLRRAPEVAVVDVRRGVLYSGSQDDVCIMNECMKQVSARPLIVFGVTGAALPVELLVRSWTSGSCSQDSSRFESTSLERRGFPPGVCACKEDLPERWCSDLSKGSGST